MFLRIISIFMRMELNTFHTGKLQVQQDGGHGYKHGAGQEKKQEYAKQRRDRSHKSTRGGGRRGKLSRTHTKAACSQGVKEERSVQERTRSDTDWKDHAISPGVHYALKAKKVVSIRSRKRKGKRKGQEGHILAQAATVTMGYEEDGEVQWRPVAHTARSWSEVEARYVKVEMESNGVLHRIASNKMHLLGQEFKCVVDHKSILSLYNHPSRPNQACVECHRMKLGHYIFKLVHKKGSANPCSYGSRQI